MTFIYKNDDDIDDIDDIDYKKNDFDEMCFNYIFNFNVCVMCYGFLSNYFSS